MTKIHLIIVATAVLIASAMVAKPQTPRVSAAIKSIPTRENPQRISFQKAGRYIAKLKVI